MNLKNVMGSLIIVLLFHSVAYANPTQRCEQATEFFTPLAQLVIDNAGTGTDPIERLCRHIDKARIYNKIAGNESEVIRQLNIIIRISTNQTPENISQSASNAFITEAQRLIELLGVDPALPDDPGEAGKATIEGIDSDGDGVRDDVQRFIAFKYPDSEMIRLMLTARAKSFQDKIGDANDEALSIQHTEESMLMSNCSEHIAWKKNIDLRDWFDMERELQAEVINTDARIRNYIIYNDQGGRRNYSAGIQRGPEEAKRHCPFDSDIIPN